MAQEDDLRALGKIMDFLRAVSIILAIMNVYWYCYEAMRMWGVTIGVVDRILINFNRTGGLFHSILYTKVFSLLLLALSCLGGAMDEKSGMNFSEYMALLSGNTDLLDKAKLEKRIASLEGERKSFNKGKRDSEFKLESKTGELRNNTAFIDAMTEDWNRFLSVAQTDREGNRLNIIKVDGVDSADEKVIGKRLQEIAKNATTGGLYTQVGELYGFPIKVVSERILKEGLEFTDNRFVVEGNYKYTYNNGHLAMADPLAAARNFLNALERIPSIIDQYKTKNEVLEREIPQLQEIAGKVWKKEDELKQLKSELAALDRKIQLELAPPTPEIAEKENEGQQVKSKAEDAQNRQAQYPEDTSPQIRSPVDSIVDNHVIIGRPGMYAKEETRSKGLKI